MSVTVTAPATFTTTVTSNAAAATIATDSTTGTAKFNTDNFAISGAGDVTIKDAGVLLTAEVTGTLPIANGGTGATAAAMVGIITAADASAARTVLELVPGTSANHLELGTAAVLAVGISNTNVLQANAVVADNDFLRIDGTTVEGRSAAEVLSDIGAQAADADLTAIAGLTSAADKGIQFTGSGTAGVYDLTAAGKALLDDADAAAQRTTLGVTNVGSYTGQIETVADKTYTLDPGAATDRTITGFYIKSASGTVTATLKNGADTVKAASVTDATGDQTGLANTSVSANGVLTLVTSSNSSALDVIFAVEYTE
jgi:hypothetical protein